MHQSIATIDSPEFINLQPLDINPLMSQCEIKVLYVGENRNRSFISKEVATEMAKTLRGAPIVGYFKEDKQDFGDHGEQIIIDDEGVKFKCLTKPYGFVAPDAKVWFQKFEDKDDFGESIVREYLMTTGYLWTGQFEECKCAVEGEGRPHSMELDNDTLEGRWAENYKKGMDFFIVNDAIFSKLCILGEDVEPCFEGSTVTAPKASSTFTKLDNNFKQTLFTMMQELKTALEGGQNKMKNFSKEEDKLEKVNNPKNEFSTGEEKTSDFVKKEEDEKEKTPEQDEKNQEAPKKEEPKDSKDDSSTSPKEEEDKKKKKEEEFKCKEEDEDKKKEDFKCKDDEDKKKYALLEQEYSALQEKFSSLEAQCSELIEFKKSIDNQKKDELIAQFYMLSDADKADVIENKAKYTLDEIESKLSVICFRKQLSFDNKKDVQKEKEQPAVTFNLESESSVPAYITALKNTKNSRKF